MPGANPLVSRSAFGRHWAPPVIERIANGITVGTYVGRARGSVLLCGSIVSVPDPPYAAEVFFGAESQGTDERAPAAMQRMGRIVRRATGKDMNTCLLTRAASN